MTSVNRPTTYSRNLPRNRRGSLHSLDGLQSSLPRKNLESMSRSELLEAKERHERMLRHRSVVHTLPDKGAKIKQSIRQIDLLLNTDTMDMDATSTTTTTTTAAAAAAAATSACTDESEGLLCQLANLNFNTPRQEARRRGIARTNARARRQSNTDLFSIYDENWVRAKVRMIGFDESLQLEQDRHQRKQDEALCSSLDHMHIDRDDKLDEAEEDHYYHHQAVATPSSISTPMMMYDPMYHIRSPSSLRNDDNYDGDDYSHDYGDHDDDDDDDDDRL
ncbi:hypothetical protein O0I10_005394 [Lichtheimia ornata]|uniref:Uncharacterized protein n=1 Tax=Lichtheimia ornata TaxID=688661 RepID=A0AAD7V6M3_9FUNG|nr:uncharacterized protein O0I10_005394 [Lichtheimia ornata]KAJ8659012.1 hypothetical protein O0I10_005394 [Lichtheimia ornata]